MVSGIFIVDHAGPLAPSPKTSRLGLAPTALMTTRTRRSRVPPLNVPSGAEALGEGVGVAGWADLAPP